MILRTQILIFIAMILFATLVFGQLILPDGNAKVYMNYIILGIFALCWILEPAIRYYYEEVKVEKNKDKQNK